MREENGKPRFLRWYASGLVAVALVLIAGSASAQGPWVMTITGAQGAYPSNNWPLFITKGFTPATSDAGEVVGATVMAGGSIRAFLWTADSGMQDLGTLGGPNASARDISNTGMVVGVSDTAAGDKHAFTWTAADGMIDLGTLGGSYSDAFAVNDLGQIVGMSYVCDDCGPLNTAVGHAFFWSASTGMVDLGTLHGGWSFAHGINNLGQIVGRDNIGAANYAFLTTVGGTMVDIGQLGVPGEGTVANDINDAGQVVGFSTISGAGVHAFLWTTDDGMVDLDPGEGSLSHARAINAAGLIAGFRTCLQAQASACGPSLVNFKSAVVWKASGQYVALRQGTDAYDVNNNGHVAGIAFATTSSVETVVWRPQPHEVVLDFGSPYGIWELGHPDWTLIHGFSADSIAAGDLDRTHLNRGAAEETDLAIDFGPLYGLWLKIKDAWIPRDPRSPDAVVAGTFLGARDSVVTDLGADGVWLFDTFYLFDQWNFRSWQLSGSDPTRLARGKVTGTLGRETLIAAFPTQGVWKWTCCEDPFDYSQGWQQIHPFDPQSITVADVDNNGQDDVILDFPGHGLWVDMNELTWTQLHGFNAQHVAGGDIDGNGQTDLVIDFGSPYGVWTFRNNSTWMPLHSLSSEEILVTDRDGTGKDEVLIDFGPIYGLWQYANDSSWSQLHGLSPEDMVAGRFH